MKLEFVTHLLFLYRLLVVGPILCILPLSPNSCGTNLSILWGKYLDRAIAKDLGENRSREVGDDGQQDCHAGCDSKENDMIEGSEVEISPKNRNISHLWKKVRMKKKKFSSPNQNYVDENHNYEW